MCVGVWLFSQRKSRKLYLESSGRENIPDQDWKLRCCFKTKKEKNKTVISGHIKCEKFYTAKCLHKMSIDK